MASVEISHCTGGEHITITVTTVRGISQRHVCASQLLADPTPEEIADMVLNNVRLRALKGKARTAQAMKLSVENVQFQEP